ncbi:hypothetical protein GCM10027413_27720 [Conyzicola nivalis]|uniref:Uncharacterized protein n=1 Tax=Conyzicola nivalis TaxID=1477021 RepID=A0A916SUP7_9MICO|nr:hypothetical protein [Conyzicola nivalis]GGB14836.1 hypothetical protein GCM10010979_31790 [Conyzicola nivalis]
MTELDDLRRVAFGRTSTAAEEAAAVEARAALANHEAHSLQVRAEREAADFTRARTNEHEVHGGATADGAPESDPPGRVTVDVVEVYDEPGYLQRLGATWRVWAVPAFAAFVVGIALTVASGLLVLNAATGDETSPPEPGVVTSFAIGSGDLEAAETLLRSPQKPEDVVAQLDSSMDTGSMHLVGKTDDQLVYAGRSVSDDICLMAVETNGDGATVCLPPGAFATQGLVIRSVGVGETVSLSWDGVDFAELRTPQ